MDIEAHVGESKGAIRTRVGEYFVLVDSGLVIRDVCRTMRKMGGGEADALLGGPLNLLFAEVDCESLRQWLANGDGQQEQPRLRLKPHDWLSPLTSLRWNVTRVDLGGSVLAVLSASLEDAEAQDRASGIFESNIIRIINRVSLAVIVTDVSHNIVVFNSGAEKLSGYEGKDTVGKKTLGDIFPIESETLRMADDLDVDGLVEGRMMSLRCADEQVRPVSVTARQLQDSSGAEVGTALFALDLTGELALTSEIESLYHQLERFGSITAQIISIEDTKEIFNHFARAITDISDFSRSLISIFTDEHPYRQIIAYSGVEEEDIRHLRSVEFPRERFENLISSDFQLSPNCFYIPSERRDTVLGDGEVAHGTIGSLEEDGWKPDDNLLVTLRSGEKLLGFFSVDDCKSGRRPTAETVKPLELFATQITEVLARNRLEEELRQRHRDLQLLYEIMVIVNSSLDAGEVLQKLVRSIRERMNYSVVSVYLIEDGKLALKAYVGPKPEETGIVLELGKGIVGAAAVEGRAVIANDVSKDERYIKGAVESWAEVAVPIKSSAVLDGEETESIIGVLNAERDTPTPFTEEDGQRLEAIAATASVAIENSRLMDRVLSLLKEEANYSQELEQKKAELDEFVYTISHDLKSPLSSIKGYAEMLELESAGDLDEQTKRFLSRIKANAEVVSRMINDLLELSRVGKVVEESLPVDLESLMHEIGLDLKARAEGEEFEIATVDLPKSVNAERRRLGQLFNNLVGNAFKYRHPERKAMITIGCELRPGEYVFRVEDNGIGIESKHLQSIFVFGVRVREVKAEGTGAGLAIAKKIVETMGGRIWAESVKGQGSVFYFTLPR